MNILIIIIACLLFYIVANVVHMFSNRDINQILLKAVHSGSISLVSASLNRGANVNTVDLNKQTPLMIASRKGFLTIAEYLIHSGAKVDYINKNGESALICAAKNNHTEIIELLELHGAKLNSKRSKGWTTKLLASAYGDNESSTMLTT